MQKNAKILLENSLNSYQGSLNSSWQQYKAAVVLVHSCGSMGHNSSRGIFFESQCQYKNDSDLGQNSILDPKITDKIKNKY